MFIDSTRKQDSKLSFPLSCSLQPPPAKGDPGNSYWGRDQLVKLEQINLRKFQLSFSFSFGSSGCGNGGGERRRRLKG
jgi:hypothetical protein